MIVENFNKLKAEIPPSVKIIAVSKTKTPAQILELYRIGHRAFGENKVQELVSKYEELPKDIEWHFIGHLQTNKVKYIASFVHLIHAVDSIKLLKEINKRAEQHKRTIDCLLQVHLAEETSKFGFDGLTLKKTLQQADLTAFTNVRIVGLMGMATHTENHAQIEREFNTLAQLFDELKTDIFSTNPHFLERSMGMSGDYSLAIDAGSSMIRMGSSIFGSREMTE